MKNFVSLAAIVVLGLFFVKSLHVVSAVVSNLFSIGCFALVVAIFAFLK